MRFILQVHDHSQELRPSIEPAEWTEDLLCTSMSSANADPQPAPEPLANAAGSQLLRSNAIVALGTGLSRLTGMLRIIVFGVVIGQTALADVYDGANNSPNAVYELLLGGVLSATLVPMFSRMLENDDRESAEAVVGTSVILLAFITAISVLCAPFIFRLFSLNPADGIDVDQFRTVGTALTESFCCRFSSTVCQQSWDLYSMHNGDSLQLHGRLCWQIL